MCIRDRLKGKQNEETFAWIRQLLESQQDTPVSYTHLEPMGMMKVYVPDSCMGDVIGDLNKRRGRILGMNPTEGGEQEVVAEVPMAEVGSYAITLRSITQDRGWFTYKFERYEDCLLYTSRRAWATSPAKSK